MLSDDEVVLIANINIQRYEMLITLTDPLVTMYYQVNNLPIWIEGHTNVNDKPIADDCISSTPLRLYL